MNPECYKITDVDDGFLAIMPKPRSDRGLEEEVRGLHSIGVRTLVSLLPATEEAHLGLENEPDVAEKHGIEFLRYPITDLGAPTSTHEFVKFIQALAPQVRQRGVAIHCRGGIGRSGLTTAVTLVALGFDPQEAFQLVSDARGVQVPETEAQLQWFDENSILFV